MAFLELRNIGKIYAGENSIAVGIRGVNLSFEKGEFVAVTGASGSGKSTLLSVISGMDTYEEGELLIEGQPTSHYVQSDWEEYRNRYISFVFQDYNIIDSFTVLQNVELSLLHIDNPQERRNKAKELLDRVGMTPFLHQKGSRLSGGQKQRTVIARALAKDSPIILADEPTGNLDSETSKEIIQLLKEVSENKLLIVVTHDFDELETVATRHIRIFDGAVEGDTVLTQTKNCSGDEDKTKNEPKKNIKKELGKGCALGWSMFTAKPKLSLFLCALLIVGCFSLFSSVASFGDSSDLFGTHEMFTHVNGRLVISRRDGEAITDTELSELAQKTGADDVIHYDGALDDEITLEYDEDYYEDYLYDGNIFELLFSSGYYGTTVKATYGKEYRNVVGSNPEKENEVVLYLPISAQSTFGKDSVKIPEITLNGVLLSVSGISYYYDNSKDAEVLFTKEGFQSFTVFSAGADFASFAYWNDEEDAVMKKFTSYSVAVDSSLPANTIATSKGSEQNEELLLYPVNKAGDEKLSAVAVNVTYIEENYTTYISSDLAKMFGELYLKENWTQASLFYANDKTAKSKIATLRDLGYTAVLSNVTYQPEAYEVVISAVLSLFTLVGMIITIVFASFFIHLCTTRSMATFRDDMAIMRSMGISALTIRIGLYARMLYTLLISFIVTGLLAMLIYITPSTNGMMSYLHWWQYLLLVAGMLILTLRVTGKQCKTLFRDSVKNTLKGDHTA